MRRADQRRGSPYRRARACAGRGLTSFVTTTPPTPGGTDSPSLLPPPIIHRGRLWPSDELAAIAAGWLEHVRPALAPESELTAMLMSNHPETVALFFALSALDRPIVVLPADPRAWRSTPPLPATTPVFVSPPLRALAVAGASTGLRLCTLPDARAAAMPRERFFACPGFVSFTSGSTGLPKPVYITTASYL